MNFYTLVNIENEVQLADVIEFEDGQVVVKYTNSITSPKVYENIDEFIHKCVLDGMELWRDGVCEY